MLLDHSALFMSYDKIQTDKVARATVQNAPRNALQAFLHTASQAKTGSGFQRMQRCRSVAVVLGLLLFTYTIFPPCQGGPGGPGPAGLAALLPPAALSRQLYSGVCEDFLED
jgi:hypothetical protein